MADAETHDLTWPILKLAFTTVIFTGLLITLFTVGNLREIAANFPRYRCNPALMPFASNFGYDTAENFNFCLNSVFQVKAAEIFTPIYNLLGGFTQVVTLITNVTLGIRKLFSNFLLGINQFVRQVRDKIQSVLFSIRMSFIKLHNLMGRVYGTMFAVIFMGTSAMTAGFNVADNDLVKFIFEFCFDPNTLITLHSGEQIPLREVKVGDRLLDVNETKVYVTSTFRFSGEKTHMVNLHGVKVSDQHYVSYGGTMIPAGEHPNSEPCESLPELVCLNVTGHTFKLGQDVYADYDEHSDQATIELVKRIAEQALNSGMVTKSKVSSYTLGIDAECSIRMIDGSLKAVKDVQLGDEFAYSGKVLGIVQEECDHIVPLGSTFVSDSTLVWNHTQAKWVRASVLLNPTPIRLVLRQFITEKASSFMIRDNAGNDYFIRDYREVPLPEMEEPYVKQFTN